MKEGGLGRESARTHDCEYSSFDLHSVFMTHITHIDPHSDREREEAIKKCDSQHSLVSDSVRSQSRSGALRLLHGARGSQSRMASSVIRSTVVSNELALHSASTDQKEYH